MFTKTNSASCLYVYDLSCDTVESKLSCFALQGLINQKTAEIYILQNQNDIKWLKDAQKNYSLIPGKNNINPGFMSMYGNYIDKIKKLIIFDTEKDWTYNLALMTGALESGIPVTEDIKNQIYTMFGEKPVLDIRCNWPDRISAYEWALTSILPCLNKKLLFSAGLRSDWKSAPWTIFDYAVASKSFIFWLDDRNAEEKQMIEKICRTDGFTLNKTMMGYGMYGDDLLNTILPYSYGFVVSDYFTNASVWSSFPDKTYEQKPASASEALPGTIYVAFQWSDGDNIQFDENSLRTNWQDPARGSVPVGTQLSPCLASLASPLLDWFYANKTEYDELLAGPDGFQFIYPDKYNKDNYISWLMNTEKWCKEAGFHFVTIDGTWGDDLNILYMEYSGIEGIALWNAGPYRDPLIHKETAQLGVSFVAGSDGDVYNSLSSLKPAENKPLFETIYLVAALYGHDGMGYSRLKNEIDRLIADYPGRFVFLKPGDLAATAKRYYSRG